MSPESFIPSALGKTVQVKQDQLPLPDATSRPSTTYRFHPFRLRLPSSKPSVRDASIADLAEGRNWRPPIRRRHRRWFPLRFPIARTSSSTSTLLPLNQRTRFQFKKTKEASNRHWASWFLDWIQPLHLIHRQVQHCFDPHPLSFRYIYYNEQSAVLHCRWFVLIESFLATIEHASSEGPAASILDSFVRAWFIYLSNKTR